MRYADFEYHALEYFGLVGDEVAALLDSMGESLRGVDEDDRAFWERATDALDDVLDVDEYEEEGWPLDPYFPDDEYLDAGELWELTAEAYTEQ